MQIENISKFWQKKKKKISIDFEGQLFKIRTFVVWLIIAKNFSFPVFLTVCLHWWMKPDLQGDHIWIFLKILLSKPKHLVTFGARYSTNVTSWIKTAVVTTLGNVWKIGLLFYFNIIVAMLIQSRSNRYTHVIYA